MTQRLTPMLCSAMSMATTDPTRDLPSRRDECTDAAGIRSSLAAGIFTITDLRFREHRRAPPARRPRRLGCVAPTTSTVPSRFR